MLWPINGSPTERHASHLLTTGNLFCAYVFLGNWLFLPLSSVLKLLYCFLENLLLSRALPNLSPLGEIVVNDKFASTSNVLSTCRNKSSSWSDIRGSKSFKFFVCRSCANTFETWLGREGCNISSHRRTINFSVVGENVSSVLTRYSPIMCNSTRTK